MTDPITLHRSAFSLPTAFALSLPFGAYALIPGVNLPLVGLILLAMGLMTLLVWRTERLLRPPFEYWWPAVALLFVFTATGVAGGHSAALYGTQLIFAFLVPLTLAAHGTVACRAITALGLATGLATLLHLAADRAWAPPTVVSLPTDLLLAGPESLSAGLSLYATGLMANCIALFHPRFSPTQRKMGGAGLLLMATWLPWLAPAIPTLLASWAPYPYTDLPAVWIVAILLGIWIVARCAARTLLLSHERADLRQGVAPAALLLLTVLHLGFATRPHLALAFLVGLAATLDTPWTGFEVTRPRRMLWAFPALCIVVQVLGFTELHPADLRNQATRCERLLEEGRWGQLDSTLAALLARQPEETNYMLLQARARLARGWAQAAVAAYTAIPPIESEESPFQARNRQAFRNALRDFASAQSPGKAPFYFERALAHDGDVDQVYHLLEIRRGRTTAIGLWNEDTATLRHAVLTLLGAPTLEAKLADWDAPALAGLLADGNVAFMRLPEELVPDTPPLLAVGSCWPGGEAASLTRLLPGTTRAGLETAPPLSPELAAVWKPLYRTEQGGWQMDFARGDTTIAVQPVRPEITPPIFADLPEVQREFMAVALYLP